MKATELRDLTLDELITKETELSADEMSLAAGREPLTRAEFELFARDLVQATGARLDTLERRQTESRAEATRALYDALATSQQLQYADLLYRLETAAPVRVQTGYVPNTNHDPQGGSR